MVIDSKRIIQQLGELVATPSVSSTSAKWDQGNRVVIDLLASWCEALGFKVQVQPVNDSGTKANMIASRGAGPGGLVLAGHSDTVPYDEGRWRSDPLCLTERDQRLYGLGSTDMKGFFPLALAAAASFADQSFKHPLIILATADEESSMSGARALAAQGFPKARAAVIGEPTGLRPIRMHKGITMQSVQVTGQAGHSSNPALGNNALEAMHGVIGELLTFRQELQARFNNPLFEVALPTMNLGCLHGGDNPNRICGQAELHFDLRLLPGCDTDALLGELRQRLDGLADQRGINIAMSALIGGVEPFEQDAGSELIQVAEKLTGHVSEVVNFATEAPFLQRLGMETVVLGPGSIDQAHQPDEFLALDQIQPCIRLLTALIHHYCIVGSSGRAA